VTAREWIPVEEYLRELRGEPRDEECKKLIRLTAQLCTESAALGAREALLVEHLTAVRGRARRLTGHRDTQTRAMSTWFPLATSTGTLTA
jgi:high-affinity nickel permease